MSQSFSNLSLTHCLELLQAAIDRTDSTIATVGTLWEVEPTTRTNRMAEVISLLERAKRKLELEIDRHQRVPPTKPTPTDSGSGTTDGTGSGT